MTISCKCTYCGCENEERANVCNGCGTSLAEPEITLMTPHRIAGKIQGSIWENLAVKRQRYYLAAFLIGAFGALLATLEHPEHGFQLWSFPVGGAFGVSAVWVLSFADRLQARINRRRGEGKSTWALQTVFVFLGLMALAVVVVLVASLGAFFI